MNLRVHQITWNVASTYPIKDELYESLFSMDKNLGYKFGDYPDFIVISFQEQTVSLIENYWESMFKRLFRKLRETKELNYIKLQSSSIFYLYQYVFIDFRLLRACRSLQTLKFSTYAGMTGKGTIAFKFKIGNESFAFLSAHLSAHDHGNRERISHYKRVISEDLFYDYSRILKCSYSFYAGDLNFRLINLDTIDLINDLNAKGRDEKYLESLFGNDQLKIAQRDSEAFEHFEEAKIKFRPTFKFHQDTDDYNPKRTPSWCDRILYRTKDTKKLKVLSYHSVPDYIQSDHKPVVAAFDLKIDTKPTSYVSPKARILPPARTDVDDKLDIWVTKKNDLNTFSMLSAARQMDRTDANQGWGAQMSWDWIGLFKEDFDDLEDYLAYLYVEDVPCNEEPPEEIKSRMCDIEKAEEAIENEMKNDELLKDQQSCSSIASFESIDDREHDIEKQIEWSKLEFSGQTFTQPGRYVLVYFNSDKSVEYISEPFEVTVN